MKYAPLTAPASSASGMFVQGFVVSGLLAAIQNQPGRPVMDRRALRLALQGGAALAAGASAAQAWSRQDVPRALTALTLGAVGVLAIEKLMHNGKENPDGQEKA